VNQHGARSPGRAPRVDDTVHTHTLLQTSGRSPGDTGGTDDPPTGNPPVIANNPAGAFLAGTAFNPTTGVGAPGVRIRVQFESTGRYLVICMNRSHLLNDHMFGFVNVVGEGNGGDK
jgi:hypothetical protein